jgi:hypothetical protein
MHRHARRWLTVAAAAIVVVVASAVPAQAAPVSYPDSIYWRVLGSVGWNADPYVPDPQNPSNYTPGDAIRACDYLADGWGVKAYLDYNQDGDADRTISTQGHNSPYCTGWATGDRREGDKMDLWGCLVKGTEAKSCFDKVEVTA